MRYPDFPPPLPKGEVLDLIERAQAGCLVSRNRVVEHHLRLVLREAKYATAWTHLSTDDLLQEGVGICCNCIRCFNRHRGDFCSYLVGGLKKHFRYLRRRERRKWPEKLRQLSEVLESVTDDTERPESLAEDRDNLEHLPGWLDTLDPKLRFVLVSRAKGVGHEQIANCLHLCKERVRQLENRGLVELARRAGQSTSVISLAKVG